MYIIGYISVIHCSLINLDVVLHNTVVKNNSVEQQCRPHCSEISGNNSSTITVATFLCSPKVRIPWHLSRELFWVFSVYQAHYRVSVLLLICYNICSSGICGSSVESIWSFTLQKRIAYIITESVCCTQSVSYFTFTLYASVQMSVCSLFAERQTVINTRKWIFLKMHSTPHPITLCHCNCERVHWYYHLA